MILWKTITMIKIPKLLRIIHFKIQMSICTKELVELIKGHARFLNSRLLKPV